MWILFRLVIFPMVGVATAYRQILSSYKEVSSIGWVKSLFIFLLGASGSVPTYTTSSFILVRFVETDVSKSIISFVVSVCYLPQVLRFLAVPMMNSVIRGSDHIRLCKFSIPLQSAIILLLFSLAFINPVGNVGIYAIFAFLCCCLATLQNNIGDYLYLVYVPQSHRSIAAGIKLAGYRFGSIVGMAGSFLLTGFISKVCQRYSSVSSGVYDRFVEFVCGNRWLVVIACSFP